MHLALVILLTVVLVPVVWFIASVAFYYGFVAKNDASGDAGLAFMVIALLPVLPFVMLAGLIYSNVKRLFQK